LVKRRIAAAGAGLDPNAFDAHSLRAGFATQAGRSGESTASIMAHTWHRSEKVFAGYVRESKRWRRPVAGFVGL
jgi:hypothetical protein